MPISRELALVACIALPLGPAIAQEPGWRSGYQMGTSYAGVSDGKAGRLTFTCGDAAAARANPAIAAGPSLAVVLGKVTGLESAKTLDLVVDGQATRVPVVARVEGDTVTFGWTPGRAFGTARMKQVVAGLRKARTIEVKAAGATQTFTTQGAAKALADDPLGC